MLFLKYYRATSDEWRDTENCYTCVRLHQQQVRPYSLCNQPNRCSCTICLRQPPSLHDAASHTLFSKRLKYFRLTGQSTYQDYVRAAMSRRVYIGKLLPTEYPVVRVWCKFDINMIQHKFHRRCPGRGTWHAVLSTSYSSPADTVKDLVELKETLWCSHCERGLFIPKTCAIHPDTDTDSN
jgi:hypothetical protein